MFLSTKIAHKGFIKISMNRLQDDHNTMERIFKTKTLHNSRWNIFFRFEVVVTSN